MMTVRPTLVDRMVAAVSPERGARRLAARMKLAAATALSSRSPTEPGGDIIGSGGYDGASTSRRQTRGWRTRPRSANADYLGGQRTLIGRSRSAAMNLPLGTAAIERTVTFTIGTGLMAIPDIRPDVVGQSPEVVAALSARIAADYDEYMSSTDPDAERSTTGYGLQDIILRGVLEAGDILQVRVMPEEQVGRTSTTAWKLVEADRIVSPTGHIEGKPAGAARSMMGEGSGNVIVGGVELDEYGAPLAFHVLRRDPGV
ncbi:MAG: phage portal protein, partial [Sphingomonadales bacterium]|nr:phage portal protein [Sphingomonadales bacterium]